MTCIIVNEVIDKLNRRRLSVLISDAKDCLDVVKLFLATQLSSIKVFRLVLEVDRVWRKWLVGWQVVLNTYIH
jgi:hypothetical protein